MVGAKFGIAIDAIPVFAELFVSFPIQQAVGCQRNCLEGARQRQIGGGSGQLWQNCLLLCS